MNNGELRVVGIGGTPRKGSTSLGALRAAGDTGAETELLDLRELNLPFHEPGRLLEEYGPEVKRFVEATWFEAAEEASREFRTVA